MADNVFALLQQAWSVSKTSDASIYGVEIAIVTNVKDPDKQGRVKVCFPRLPGKPESDWARVCQPAAGDGRGWYWLPEVSDEVLVAFERGQASIPYVVGALWNGKDKPMKDAYTDENTTRMIQTKSGHQIVFNDKSGEEKLTIGDKSGKRTITFDVKEKKFLIEAGEGDVEFHAKKKMVLLCEDLEIKTKKTGKFEIGSKFDLKVAQKAGFKAGPKWEIKADKVNLNPPSLSLEAIIGAIAGAIAGAAAAAAAGGNVAEGAAAGAAAGFEAGAAAGAGGGLVPTKDVLEAAAAGAAAGAEAGGKAGAGAGDGSDWTKAKDGGGGASGDGGKTSGDKGGADAKGGADGGKTSGGTGADGQAGKDGAGKDAPPAAGDVAVTLQDQGGNPASGVSWEVTMPDGTKKTGTTSGDGKVSVTGGQGSGSYKLVLPDIDKSGAAPPPSGDGGTSTSGTQQGKGGDAPEPADGTKTDSSAQPGSTPQQDDAQDLNPWVLKVIQSLGSGGGYAWPHAEEGTHGVSEDVVYQGTRVAKAASTRETYCCGQTYEVMVKAYKLYCEEKGIPFKIGNLSVQDMLNVRTDWFIAGSGLKGPVDGLVSRGLGQEITDPSQAKPGDFVQLWRGAPPSSGHSVIFMGMKGDKLHYWSTQPGTSGRGENTEPFHTLFIARASLPKP